MNQEPDQIDMMDAPELRGELRKTLIELEALRRRHVHDFDPISQLCECGEIRS